MMDTRPGLNPTRLVRLMRSAIEDCELRLDGYTVLTEAATGAYAVTPVLAAMAGAERVFAVARPTRHGTAEEATCAVGRLAGLAGVERRIEIIARKTPEIVGQADIFTNSCHLRPIDSETVSWMKPTAVVPLMFEAWEFRPQDLDLDACRRRGIPVAGTNERHPSVNVFSYLGNLACKLLMDAGVAVYGTQVLVLCDNPFLPYLARGLQGAGAIVESAATVAEAVARGRLYDAVLLALGPQQGRGIDAAGVALAAEAWPGAVIGQFFSDIDRAAVATNGVPIWPPEQPSFGHMGILPSAIGPEPIVRLQAGGLKVGEILASQRRMRKSVSDSISALETTGYGEGL